MREDLERFVASLKIPADRKTVVLAELLDHASCARETAVREGGDPDAAERAAVGNLEALRRSLEAIEPAFRMSRWHALARGLVAGVLVAILIGQGGATMAGVLGAALALAIAAVFAPPRLLELLRAETRASHLRGRPQIGPALAYCFAVLATPFLVWNTMIVVRVVGGDMEFDTPLSCFAVLAVLGPLLFVEAFRARRAVT